jgi:hypothetical protein
VNHHSQFFGAGSLGNADPVPLGQKDFDVAYAAENGGLLDFYEPVATAVIQLMFPVLKGVAGQAMLSTIRNLRGPTGSPRFQMLLPLFPEDGTPGCLLVSQVFHGRQYAPSDLLLNRWG